MTHETKLEQPVLKLDRVSKSFGSVQALANVSLEIRPHEIVGLIGENGAGKSTLLKILSGNQRHDRGTFELRGSQAAIASVSDAMSRGIAMVHQEQSLVPNVSVAENILLGNEGDAVRGGFYNWRRLNSTAQHYLDAVGSEARPSDITDTLPFSSRQMVEVAKALATGARSGKSPVMLLDEPTSVLEKGDIEKLFSVIRDIKRTASVIFVSHRLEEVLEICDRVYVMRDGQVVAETTPSTADVDELFRLMVGRDLTSGYFREDLSAPPMAETILEVSDLSGTGFSEISLSLKRGEIVSILGVQESGREELARSLFGAVPASTGEIRIGGNRVSLRSTHSAADAGIAYVPSERKVDGAVMSMSVADNMTLAHPERVSTAGILMRQRTNQIASEWIGRLGIKTESAETLLRNLSGGNQQKVVLAKWMLDPKLRVLILDTPTRGLDVGAKADVYSVMRGLAARGVAIILLADSIEEGIYLSHRVLTMMDGSITGEFASSPEDRPSRTAVLERML